MKKINIHTLLMLVFIGLVSCSDSQSDKNTNTPEPSNVDVTLTINTDSEYQTIDNFGASDAWSCQFVGNWPSAKKEAIAKLLFSKNVTGEGNPEGIGLSMWRFNIGAGSAFQQSASGIDDAWRRAESFLQPNGTYNFAKQQGQVWFANSAKNYNVENFLIFSNSPPVNITKNGKAFADAGGITNLAYSNFNAYATYLANVANGLKDLGLTPDYISPVNEPQWDWDGGQEGTPFYNNEVAQLTGFLSTELAAKNLNTKIILAEAGEINYMYETGNKQGRANQIEDFFTTGSSNYIADVANVENTIAGHSYFTTSPFNTAVSMRQTLQDKVANVNGLQYWMSEYCILGDNNGDIDGNIRDLGITPALYLAQTIHLDLAVANATAWQWWLAISPYNYKDGLIYIDKNETDGNYYDSKMLWALGNYSRFIRPGYVRVNVTSSNSASLNQSLLFSSYKNPETGKTVTVVVNQKTTDVTMEVAKGDNTLTTYKTYVTSAGKNLELVTDETLTIPAKSIVTIVEE